MAASGQYNLRKTVRVPVELQGDHQFLEDLLTAEASHTNGISDNSLSSLDCSDLINASDSELDFITPAQRPPKGEQVQSTHENTDQNSMSSESGTLTQSAINTEILNQLQKLGDRLDSLEK